MDIQTAIINRRTIRRFLDKPIELDTLKKIVDLSRFYASAANLQPIRFAIINQQPQLDGVFETLRWAGYLPGFKIENDQRPTGYVVLYCDEKVKRSCQFDVGAAATTLMLAAEGEGLSTCCLASFNTEIISRILSLPETQTPAMVIALGYPLQKSRAVEMRDDVKYFEDENGCLCVPKRSFDEVAKVI